MVGVEETLSIQQPAYEMLFRDCRNEYMRYIKVFHRNIQQDSKIIEILCTYHINILHDLKAKL